MRSSYPDSPYVSQAEELIKVISMFGSMGLAMLPNFLNNRLFNHQSLLGVPRANRYVDIQIHAILQPLE